MKINQSLKKLVRLVSTFALVLALSACGSELSETSTPVSSEATSDASSAKAEELAAKYNPIWDNYSALNEDYIAYLEWGNDLLYNYGDDTTDPYPHVIVRSRVVDDGEGNMNVANSEYMRNDISHAQRSFGQDFMDGESKVDENYVPQDQNIIIYGHYVYPSKYGVDYLKFTHCINLKIWKTSKTMIPLH